MRNYAPLLFTFAFATGMWLTDRSWNGQVYVYIGEERSPAAVRSLGEYTSFDRRALIRTAHEQLLAEAEVQERPGQLGLQFGHPLVDRSGGGREFGCQVQDRTGAFDRIELVFSGTGVSSGGESPRMVVTTNCRASDVKHLDTIWIPVRELLSLPPQNQDLMIPSQDPVQIHLEAMADQWPETWVLMSIRLFRSESGNIRELKIGADLMRQSRPALLSLNWKAAQ